MLGTENTYLRAWFGSQKIDLQYVFHEYVCVSQIIRQSGIAVQARQDADFDYSHFVGSLVRSLRRSHLHDAGNRTMAMEIGSEPEPDVDAEPFNTLWLSLRRMTSTRFVSNP